LLSIIYFIVFALLVLGAFIMFEINPFKRKSYILLSKQILSEKNKNVDERFVKLSIREQLMTTIGNTVEMCGGSINTFWILVLISGCIGLGLGSYMFCNELLAIFTAVIMLPAPYIYYKVKSRWYRRNQDELLENTLSIITNSYISCNDIISAVNENLSKLDIYTPFAEFLTDITLIDSNVKRALRRLELKINNRFFSELIDILVLSQEKSGDMRFILPAVVQSMNDAKKLQIEADTVMINVWKEYFVSIALAFSIIPILKCSNEQWFYILVNNFIGKMLIVLMLVMTMVSSFIVMGINKPL